MSVLHLMQCTNLGGMEQVTYRLMEELSKRDVHFRLATPMPFGPGADRARRYDPGMRDFPYRGRFGWQDFPAFRAHIRRLAADCSHCWVTGTSAAALAALVGLHKPKILSHHYHHYEGRFPWLRWRAFYELLGRQLDAITYPTAFTRDEAVRIAPWLKGRVHVVPNGFTIHYRGEADRLQRRHAARERLKLPEEALIVGNAGWLIPRKRFDVFLQTARRVKAAKPNAYFVICGGGPLEGELRSLAASLGLQEAVRFEGWQADLTPYYEAWDLLLFNSDFDTLPATPMEAASYGCVTVASQIYGGLGEFLISERTGYLCTRHDEHALADAIVRFADDPDWARSLRDGALSKLADEFSVERTVNFYQRFFGQA